MKKIGILTLFEGNYNYGGLLQAYALCSKVNKMGYECKVISYSDNYNPIYPSLKEQLKQYSKTEIIKKVLERIVEKKSSKKFKEIYLKRVKLMDYFIENNIPHTEHYNNESLIENLQKFDIFISGSDQVWNPNCARIAFLQLFSYDSIKKVSYAASISRNSLSMKEKEIMIPAINDFDYIGVREYTAKKILEQDIKKDIYVNLDPTLLLSKNEWNNICSKRIIDEEYVLCYFFSNSYKYRKYIENICKNKNLKLVYIPFAKQKYNNFDNKGTGLMLEDIGPSEFLSLINNAKYVFTDSFHGAVFSIIFEKNFFVFERDKNTKVSKNSRLYDLLEKFSLSNRLIKNNDELMQQMNTEINFEFVKTILTDEKKQSLTFLKNALGKE